jgi:MFS transporter, BCD family, chlorophyll transporter
MNTFFTEVKGDLTMLENNLSRFDRTAIDSSSVPPVAHHTTRTHHSTDTGGETFIENLSRQIPLPRVLQICLMQLSTAIVYVLLNSTLNRVLVVELAVPAWLVGVLIGFHNLLAFVRPAVGFYSDSHLLFGYRRTPIIIAGNLLSVSGVIMAGYGAAMLPSSYTFGISVLLCAFTLYGVGINMTGTMFYALLADSAGEKHKPKAVTVGWFILILGTIVASAFIGKYLEAFSLEKMISLFWIGGGIAVGLTWLSLLKSEKRFATERDIVLNKRVDIEFGQTVKKLVKHKTAASFFLFMFITVVAIQGQDVILEPFGAEVFGMSVSQTTELTRIWGTGTMLGIVTLGLFFVNRVGKKNTTYLGCIASAIGFMVICISPLYEVFTFKTGVFLLGVGNGALTVGTLSIMMDMTTRANAGLFMGVWGMGQALANFVANTVGGAIRDISLWITGNIYIGYTAAFALEVVGLVAAIIVLRGINILEFREHTALTDIVGAED